MRNYAVKEVKKDIKKTWIEISDYLELKLSWDDLLKKIKKKYKKFLIRPTKKEWGIFYGGKRDKKNIMVYSYVGLNFRSKLMPGDVPRYQLGHELVHLYKATCVGEFFKISKLIDIFEEAYADVISIKSIKDKNISKKIAFLRKNFYAVPEIVMLSEILYRLDRLKLIKYANRPCSKKDAQVIFQEILNLFKKANQEKWLKVLFDKNKR